MGITEINTWTTEFAPDGNHVRLFEAFDVKPEGFFDVMQSEFQLGLGMVDPISGLEVHHIRVTIHQISNRLRAVVFVSEESMMRDRYGEDPDGD